MYLFSKKTLEGKRCNIRGDVSSVSQRGFFFIVFWSANSNQTQSHCAVRGTLITNPRLPVSPIDCLFVRIFEREMSPSEKKKKKKTDLLSNTAKSGLSLSHCVLIIKTKRLFRENYTGQRGWRQRRWRRKHMKKKDLI